MREHAAGAEIIENIKHMGNMRILSGIIKKGGRQGYPDGLTGENIPWVKIVCVADAFDAMTTGRFTAAP